MTDFENATTEELGWPLTKNFPYVDALQITLSEETEEEVRSDPVEYYTICHQWSASYKGRPYVWKSDLAGAYKKEGPEVEMIRYGKTAKDAYRTLVAALTEQGWTVC